MSALFPPPQTRVIGTVDKSGKVQIDFAWFVYLTQGLYERTGGALGPSTDDLATAAFEDAGIEESRALAMSVLEELRRLPIAEPVQNDPVVTPELAELRERVAVLERAIDDLKQGLTA